jgi:hypothetical protein
MYCQGSGHPDSIGSRMSAIAFTPIKQSDGKSVAEAVRAGYVKIEAIRHISARAVDGIDVFDYFPASA